MIFFHLKKTTAESYQLLVEAYGVHALTQKICERWLKRFISGDFDLKDKGRPGQLNTAHFDRCNKDFQHNTSILMKKWKFELMNGWPQKMNSSFKTESIL